MRHLKLLSDLLISPIKCNLNESFLSSMIAVKRDKAVIILFGVSTCVSSFVRASVRPSVNPSGFVRATTSTFIHGLQNHLALLFSLRTKSVI